MGEAPVLPSVSSGLSMIGGPLRGSKMNGQTTDNVLCPEEKQDVYTFINQLVHIFDNVN